jgi:hypothetical protein
VCVVAGNEAEVSSTIFILREVCACFPGIFCNTNCKLYKNVVETRFLHLLRRTLRTRWLESPFWNKRVPLPISVARKRLVACTITLELYQAKQVSQFQYMLHQLRLHKSDLIYTDRFFGTRLCFHHNRTSVSFFIY